MRRQRHQHRGPAGDVAADQQPAARWPPCSARRQAEAADGGVVPAESRRRCLQ